MHLDRKRMLMAYPAPPAPVKDRVEQTLAAIRREAAAQPPRRYARRLSFAAVTALAVLLVAVAVAAGAHFGVFDFMAKLFGASGVLPEAQELVQADLGGLELEHTVLHVDEAVYDGGALHLVYSITQKGAAAPLTEQDTGDPQSLFNQACTADQVLTVCDSFWLNGEEHVMTGGSFCDTMIGAEDGTLLCYLDIQLASAGIVPDGDFTVGLPVVGGHGVCQTLDFTVKAANGERQPMVLHCDNETVTLQNAFVSPVRIYASVHVEISEGVAAQQADDVFTDWAEAELVDAQGNELASLADLMRQNVVGRESVDYCYTFLPVDAEGLYLAPTIINDQGEWAVDMTRALPLN